jgi:hypothetical protein
LARHGKNTTSVLGQYGEELQVKTYTIGRRPGNIRSFIYDVVTVEIDPDTACVVSARRYRFDRGWTIGSKVKFTEVTNKFSALEPFQL